MSNVQQYIYPLPKCKGGMFRTRKSWSPTRIYYYCPTFQNCFSSTSEISHYSFIQMIFKCRCYLHLPFSRFPTPSCLSGWLSGVLFLLETHPWEVSLVAPSLLVICDCKNKCGFLFLFFLFWFLKGTFAGPHSEWTFTCPYYFSEIFPAFQPLLWLLGSRLTFRQSFVDGWKREPGGGAWRWVILNMGACLVDRGGPQSTLMGFIWRVKCTHPRLPCQRSLTIALSRHLAGSFGWASDFGSGGDLRVPG